MKKLTKARVDLLLNYLEKAQNYTLFLANVKWDTPNNELESVMPPKLFDIHMHISDAIEIVCNNPEFREEWW